MQHTEREIKAAEKCMYDFHSHDDDIKKAHLAGQQWQKDNAWLPVSSGQLPHPGKLSLLFNSSDSTMALIKYDTETTLEFDFWQYIAPPKQ